MPRTTLAERFWAKVDKRGPEECWLWTARVAGRRYGQIFIEYRNGRPFCDVAHRTAYELQVGPIPAGLYIDHTCMNRFCVNAAHLRAVTPKVSATENCTSPFAENARKTHCTRWHLFDAANTELYWRNGRPQRQCIACRKVRPSYYVKRIAA